MLSICLETISEKINLQKKVFRDKKCILLPHPLFSIIINSGAMKELKWFKQLQTHIFVVDIYRQLKKSSKYIKIIG